MASSIKSRSAFVGLARLAAWVLLPVIWAGCAPDPEIPVSSDATLPEPAPADDSNSCVSCHPRQFAEWVGSSHNYGNGLDGTFQALEITANYYADHALGVPYFRQNVLCISCHAPGAAPYLKESGVLNSNVALREGFTAQDTVGRDLKRPSAGTDLLPPPGRAIEMMEDDGLTPDELAVRKRVSFQGITCDSCHKVSGPLDDRQEGSGCAEGEDQKVCAARQFEECLQTDDPRCKRRTRGGHAHDEPFFEIGISNFGFLYEREGSTRFGPFAGDDVSPATAHDVSSGGTDFARNYNIAAYPDGTPFEGQPEDRRPYLKTSQFCGACHDVRLDSNSGATPLTDLEPIHNEPFLRLENLYTEWFISPLNLHPEHQGDTDDPRLMWRDNPFRNEDGSAKRILCQDCHMALYPYGQPGRFPGEFTHPDSCDDAGDCGLLAAEAGSRSNLRIRRRDRVTTHNMTGVDIGLGHIEPISDGLAGTTGTNLPLQTSRDDLSGAAVYSGAEAMDEIFNLPTSVDTRRQAVLANAVSISMAGTPEFIDRANPEGCEEAGTCCDEAGVCSLPIKAWVTNVNGGHNIAAGFSQERQIWVELTVQDMGRKDETGQGMLVDCALVPKISELYTDEGVDAKGYPTRRPRSHTQPSATDLFNRLTGIDPDTGEFEHEMVCRGLSGHLIDKPHDETYEPQADGRLDDEDILLHRIGNTLPEYENGDQGISWHVLDLGFSLDGDVADPVLGKPAPNADSARVARADQFHVPGLNPFQCELTGTHLNPALASMPVVTIDGTAKPLSELGNLKQSVVQTPDERAEILYPFPEYKPLRPHYDDEGHWHLGERFGLAYLTNIFYRICGCQEGECEGPEEIQIDGEDYHAQVPWLATYPTLPHEGTLDENHPAHDSYHFPFDTHEFDELLGELNMPNGTPYSEAFTFIPLNANHMPNNRSLKYFEPQRHYWDIRVGPDVVGPIRVTTKVWYRHFPPEFLRLMIRATVSIYERALAEGLAEDYFPHGPLVVEGELKEMYPQAATVDNLRRVLLDESVMFVNIGAAPEAPANPTYTKDVAPILANHCLPCHSDILQHGGLIFDYDDHPQYDALPGDNRNPNQDPRLNLVDVDSRYGNGRKIVVPGDVEGSVLWDVLTKTDDQLMSEGILSRRMPLKTDMLPAAELQTIRNWIATGAK